MELIGKITVLFWRLLQSPQIFIEREKIEVVFVKSLKLLIYLFAGGVALLLLSSIANLEILQSNNDVMLRAIPDALRSSSLIALAGWIPWNNFFFPIFFLLYLPIISILRFMTLKLLGDGTKIFLVSLTISALGVIPVVVSTLISGILNNLFPIRLIPGTAGEPGIVQMVSFLLSLAGSISEIRIVVILCKSVFHQNIGRAILTYLIPIFILCFLVFLTSFVTFLLMTG